MVMGHSFLRLETLISKMYSVKETSKTCLTCAPGYNLYGKIEVVMTQKNVLRDKLLHVKDPLSNRWHLSTTSLTRWIARWNSLSTKNIRSKF